MIEIFETSKRPDSFVGKIVWLDAGMLYGKIGGAALVDGMTASGKCVGRKLSRDRKTFEYDGVSDDSMDAVEIPAGRIVAVCDTVAEANAVRAANVRSEQLYYDAIKAGRALLSELDGTAVEGTHSIEPNQGPKP